MMTAGMLRMIGCLTVFVGLAWAVQILGFGDAVSLASRFAWVLAAATVCGAGVGLMVTAGTMPDAAEAVAGI
jgi:hypothetical protein